MVEELHPYCLAGLGSSAQPHYPPATDGQPHRGAALDLKAKCSPVSQAKRFHRSFGGSPSPPPRRLPAEAEKAAAGLARERMSSPRPRRRPDQTGPGPAAGRPAGRPPSLPPAAAPAPLSALRRGRRGAAGAPTPGEERTRGPRRRLRRASPASRGRKSGTEHPGSPGRAPPAPLSPAEGGFPPRPPPPHASPGRSSAAAAGRGSERTAGPCRPSPPARGAAAPSPSPGGSGPWARAA